MLVKRQNDNIASGAFKSLILVISRFGFEGWIWVLIVSVPDLCILFTFNNMCSYLFMEYLNNLEANFEMQLK